RARTPLRPPAHRRVSTLQGGRRSAGSRAPERQVEQAKSDTRTNESRVLPDSGSLRRHQNHQTRAGEGTASSSWGLVSVDLHPATRLDLEKLAPPKNRSSEEAGDEHGKGQGITNG